MKDGYLKKENRKKILLMCDDITATSGIATMAREMVVGTCHHYNWVNLGGAIHHPNEGQKIDLSIDSGKLNGIDNASVMLYPISGYGNEQIVFQLMEMEKPDAIMIFTDPRYWTWLFEIERDIRKKIPITYLSIWDDLPYPMYNKQFYESCDALFGISKQTDNIHRVVLGESGKDKVIKYVPHGINENAFYPIDQNLEALVNFKQNALGGKDYDFIVCWNNRNIRRKKASDILLAFKVFLDTLPKEKADKCLLYMKTRAVDENGTDLNAVKEMLFNTDSAVNIIIDQNIYATDQLNYMYNMSDVCISLSDNEGWGLSLTEAMMAGKMIISTAQGGPNDQMRFVDENGKWINYSQFFPSNNFATYKECGEWAVPVFPSNITLNGSVPTPYIYSSNADFRDAAKAISDVYQMGAKERNRRGQKAREWVVSDESMMSARWMSKNIIDGVDETLSKFVPRSSFDLTKYDKSQVATNFVEQKFIY
jgi:glycosyltransferase involved in cell wall biosynthesis